MSHFVISVEAQSDLEEIWLYAAENSENAADRLIDRLCQRFPTLARFPEMGRERSELATKLRSFPVGRYLVFYRPLDNGIEIVRVLHGAKDIDSLFQ
jgi:toxin ParE1/3/4